MNKSLSREELSHHVVKNAEYYEAYLEKFNKKQSFYSWNWAAMLIPQLWLPYRKQWGLFIVLFVFISMALFINYLAIIHPREVSPFLLLGISAITIALMIYVPLKANQKVLEHAVLFKSNQGYNSWPIVLLASLVFTAPIQLFLYKAGVLILKEQRVMLLETLGRHQYSDKKILGVLEALPSESITYKAINELLCYNNKSLLSALSAKKITFSMKDIQTAYHCKATYSIAHIVQSGTVPSKRIIIIAVHNKRLDTVKALLNAKPQITEQYLAYSLGEDKEQVDEKLAEYLLSKTNLSRPYYDKNNNIVSALDIALYNNNFKWAERLLQAGANPNIIIHGSDSLLKRAVAKQSLESIDLLLRYKADPNFHENDYQSAILERAIKTNNPQVVEKILQAGAMITPRILKINNKLHQSKFQSEQEVWSDAERESSTRITQLLKDYKK